MLIHFFGKKSIKKKGIKFINNFIKQVKFNLPFDEK